MTVHSSSGALAARRLDQLAKLYEKGQASDLMTRTLDKLLGYEAEASRAQLKEMEKALAEFEARYKMASADFYQKYQAGQTDDRMDFVEWASLVQMAENLKRRLQLLTDEGQV